jgi:hypothetical protein
MLLRVKRDADDTATLGLRTVYLLQVAVVIDMHGQVDSVSARSTTTSWILISDATFLAVRDMPVPSVYMYTNLCTKNPIEYELTQALPSRQGALSTHTLAGYPIFYPFYASYTHKSFHKSHHSCNSSPNVRKNVMKSQLIFRCASPAKAPITTRISNQPNQPGERTTNNIP